MSVCNYCIAAIVPRLNAEWQEKVDRMTAERDALIAENKWHPASEPPTDNRDVWTSDGQGYYDSKDQQWWGNDGYGRITSIFVAHWRELPRPPTAIERGEP